jgi:hypothetical protein
MSSPARGARRALVTLATVVLLAAAAGPAPAAVAPAPTPAGEQAMRHPDLRVATVFQPAARLPARLRAALDLDLAVLGVAPEAAFLDLRGGRWGTLLPAEPLLPGEGIGNELRWEDFGGDVRGDEPALRRVAWDAFVGYLRDHRAQLRIDPAELTRPGYFAAHQGGDLIQLVAPRVVHGVPVRDSYLTAVIRAGNLILLGADHWGDVAVSTAPTRSVEEATATVQAHLGDLAVVGAWRKPHLVLVPTVQGDGYGHRLAWVLSPLVEADLGRWEALVDAHGGELLAFRDTRQYATTRTVVGGVYPVANDGVPPDGVEQAGWPMPFADVVNGPDTRSTDSGGNLNRCVDGSIATHLDGEFVRIADQCGAVIEATGGDVLDLGTGGGTDCAVPPGHSAGDTHAARSAFYELNRIKEQARGQLPGNAWLRGRLTANLNISPLCNASWNGSEVNFFRADPPDCRNDGELAGVVDHEWGHGMDNHGVNPNIASPGEGIADVYAALRLDASCIGRGFWISQLCDGYGDPCTVASGCDGLRDIDWAHRTSGSPHDIAWIDAHCAPSPQGNDGPCGGGVHCEGAVYAEAVWDLFNRDLTAGVFDYDHDRALELATRLTFLGAGPVGVWFQCAPGTGTGDGCNASGGYLNYLAVDDDDGNLNNGTPHMTAIHAAFDRHGVACPTPAVQNSGCAGAPAAAPSVTATALDRGARLSWGAVAGAGKYAIYRTEGVSGCDSGKEKVGETTATAFDHGGLMNGRAYHYVVAALGADDSCIGPMSGCTTVTPSPGPNLFFDGASFAVAIETGDGDLFLDNCEAATVTFDVTNNGTGTQTDVRIVDVVPLSHPETQVTTPFPSTIAASLAACATVQGSFDLVGDGLAFDDTLELRIDVTSDELGGVVKSTTVSIPSTASDLQTFATRTFDFEADLNGWSVLQGTFNRSGGGGGNGTTFALRSSTFLDAQCDRVRSPTMRLTPTSTLSLWNNYDIEPLSAGTWYDRANLGLIKQSDGSRTIVGPSGGRLYNAVPGGPGVYTGCNDGQPGWAGAQPTWGTSTWTAAALQSPAFAGQFVQLEMTYATDASLALRGFWFDQATLTNVEFQVPDAGPCVLFADGFESGDTSAWAATVP